MAEFQFRVILLPMVNGEIFDDDVDDGFDDGVEECDVDGRVKGRKIDGVDVDVDDHFVAGVVAGDVACSVGSGNDTSTVDVGLISSAVAVDGAVDGADDGANDGVALMLVTLMKVLMLWTALIILKEW